VGQDQCLTAKVAALVANPAVAGIDAELHWSDLNPAPSVYAWNEHENGPPLDQSGKHN
jgi:hypothetical protein